MVDTSERFYIGTTRFTNNTYKENSDWRERFKWNGCIYGCNKKMPLTIPHLALVFVIEMNNDTNQIMGIGLVRNYINSKYNMCIYTSDTNYNRYIYNSSYRKDRVEINKKLLAALEIILFKGKGHYKRGQGITTIPWKRFGGSGAYIYKLFQKLFN
jgi:hypothetical protein|uniref:Uncharacterized protein n=1 Tax=viral metagenome TaxID=1070528 RepID=A0A6C0C5F9_9ZZZZ